MPTFKTENKEGKYKDSNAIGAVVNYILQENKTVPELCGSFGVDPNNIVGSMTEIAESFNKTSGVKLRHFTLSFHPKETKDPAIVSEIGYNVARYLFKNFQTIYAVHTDKQYLHVHIVVNAVSYIDGHKYRGTKEAFYQLINFLNHLLEAYGFEEVRYVSS